MKTRWMLTVCLCVVSCCSVHAVEQGVLESVLREAYPEASVELVSETEGTMSVGEETVSFQLQCVKDFELDGVPCVAMFLAYDGYYEEHRVLFWKKKTFRRSKHKNEILFAQLSVPVTVRKEVVDEHATSTSGHEIEIADFVGAGSSQLKLEANSRYSLKRPRAEIQASRRYVYELPQLKRLVAVTFRRSSWVRFKDNAPKTLEVRFMREPQGRKTLQIIDRERLEEKRIKASQDGTYDLQDTPWILTQEELTQRRSARILKIRVVDEEGEPIVGAWISGSVPAFTFSPWDARCKDVNGWTNKKGEYKRWVSGSIHVSLISAEGYYEVKGNRPTFPGWPAGDMLSWSKHRDPVPQDWLVITMEKQHEKVDMISTGVRNIWREALEEYEIGVKFVEERKQVFVTERGDADIWIEVSRDGIPLEKETWKDWGILLTGMKGWTIAPGSMFDETPVGETMRVAPDKGYKGSLKYTLGTCPQGFFIKQKGKERYGKIWRFKFQAEKRSDLSEQHMFWLSFSVQKEETGKRSLNRGR